MELKKIKLFVKRKKKILIVSLLILSVLILSVLILSSFFLSGTLDKLLYEFPKFIAEKTGTAFNIVVVEKSNFFFSLLDEINIFYLKKNLLDGNLPVYNLELSENDLKHIESVSETSIKKGYLFRPLNKWRRAKFGFNGKEYKVNVKLHGDYFDHWNGNLKSYKVKFEEASVNNIRRFNLILFEDRRLTGKISGLLANDLGLFDIKSEVVVLKINGVVQGLYSLQEVLGEDFFERNQCSNCLLVRTTDNWIEDHPRANYPDLNGITDGPGHGTDFDNELSNINMDVENIITPKMFYVLDEFFEFVNNKDVDEVSKYFDLEQLASFEAFRLLVANAHFIHGDNLKMAYSASTGKFYPLPVNEVFGELKLEKGGVEHSINQDVPIFALLTRNEKVRHLRNKKLYAYILDSAILEEIDQLMGVYWPYAFSYKTNKLSKRYLEYRLKKDRKLLEKNLEIIRKNLEYAKSYIDIIEQGNTVKMEVIPDSIAQIKFDRLAVNLVDDYSGRITFTYRDENNHTLTKEAVVEESSKVFDLSRFVGGLYFSAGLDEEMYPTKRSYWIEVIFEDAERIDVNKVDIEMSNDISGQPIKEDDIYFQIADGNEFYPDSKELSFSEFKQKHPKFNWAYQDDELTLLSGKYILTEDLVVPKFSKFVIEAGTIISLASEKSIMSYSPVEIRGERFSPVVIKALDPSKPFGTFGVLGAGKSENGGGGQKRTVIEWLDLSGGKEQIINGIYFSGGLSVYNMDLELKDSKIHDNHADDGLIVKYADILVYDSEFYNNFADQFDCDFCTGIVKDSEFRDSESGDNNGDGLDFSGSEVVVRNSEFKGFRDKGVSVGEKTKIILFDNSFADNNMGAAIKDSSHAFFVGNKFVGNEIALSAYQKKQLYNGGYVYVFGSQFKGNGKKYGADELSKFYNINFAEGDKASLLGYVKNDEVSSALELVDKYIKWKYEETN